MNQSSLIIKDRMTPEMDLNNNMFEPQTSVSRVITLWRYTIIYYYY